MVGRQLPVLGLAALAAALSVVELALSVLPDRSEARDGTLRGFLLECEVAYGAMGWWLFTLAAWRALWFDEEQQSGVWRRNADMRAAEELRRQSRINRLERHFYSLVGAFSLWGATGAALGRTWPSSSAAPASSPSAASSSTRCSASRWSSPACSASPPASRSRPRAARELLEQGAGTCGRGLYISIAARPL